MLLEEAALALLSECEELIHRPVHFDGIDRKNRCVVWNEFEKCWERWGSEVLNKL